MFSGLDNETISSWGQIVMRVFDVCPGISAQWPDIYPGTDAWLESSEV